MSKPESLRPAAFRRRPTEAAVREALWVIAGAALIVGIFGAGLLWLDHVVDHLPLELEAEAYRSLD